ncbi:MAG: site-specific DNA-methyltransferase [Ruminococcus sp.]|nr:site-specific DNA-methyltransferase [Ruminococcus sp.]MBR1764716.1 site-specific DNA-methyltransferase [Ruminococcus sp.]
MPEKAFSVCIKDSVFIDPPYNTGNDFIYRDDFAVSANDYAEESGQLDEDGNRLFKNTDSNGRFHSDWCSMIYSRLMLARNLLSDDGVIFISIDDNEVENLKKICEEVFGDTNFIANIIWKHTQQSKNDEPHFSRQYNHTLVYSKSKDDLPHFYFERTDEDNKNYSNPDNDPKGAWRSGDVRSPNYRKTLCYDIIAPNGTIIKAPADR